MAVGTRRGTRRRRGSPAAVQEPLFEVRLRPERRYFRQILQVLTSSAFATDPLLAEITVSKVLGVVWGSDPRRDGAVEEAFGLGLVEYARQSRTPTAVTVLRTVATIGTIREVREAAAVAADALVREGLPAPPWSLGSILRGRCWAHEDAFGDLTTVVCEYGYGPTLKTAQWHGLVVQVDHVSFSAATDASIVDDVDGTIHDLQFGASHATHRLRQVEAGWAGAVLERALARTDLIPSVPVGAGFAETRALAMARVRALPASPEPVPADAEPTGPRRRAVVEEFLASPEASLLVGATDLASPPGGAEQPAAVVVDRAEAASVARLIVEFASLHDPGELTRVSPGRWDAFLFEWLPLSAGPASRERIADVVRAWSAWAARHGGLSLATREELAHALDEILEEYRGGDAAPSPSG